MIATEDKLIVPDTRLNAMTSSNPSIEKMGVLAWAGFPVRSRDGMVLGSFCVVDVEPHEWTEADVDILSTLTASAETEIDLRMMLEEAQAEVARSERIAELSDSLSSADSVAAVAKIVTESGAKLLGARLANIAVFDESRRSLIVHHPEPLRSSPISAKYRTLPLSYPTALTDAVNQKRSVLIGDHDERVALYPDLAADNAATQLVATAAVPMFRSDGEVLGAIGLGWDHAREFDAAGRVLLEATATMCAAAVQRAQLGDMRDALVRTLQHELQPIVPSVASLDIAVRYLPSQQALGLGGDWYDVIDLGSGRVAVVVGDIVGHGIQAAARMAQVRATVNALIRFDPDDIATVFDRAERMLEHLEEPYIATVNVAIIDTKTRSISYVSAGHPPAVLIRRNGDVEVVEDGRRPLLGAGTRIVTPGHRPFGSGDAYLAFTDGLVERPTLSFDAGTAEAARAAAQAIKSHRDADAVLDHVVDVMLETGETHDDVAAVFVRAFD